MLKKISFFIVLIYLLGLIGAALSEIIPLKKPLQTKEETEKKLLIDVLKPLKKPKKIEITAFKENKIVRVKICITIIIKLVNTRKICSS